MSKLGMVYGSFLILIFSALGILVRVVLDLAVATAALSAPRDNALLIRFIKSLLPNVLGSFLMGVLVAVRTRTRLGPRTYEALASGFLGSLTTFSGWIGGAWSAVVVERSTTLFLVSFLIPPMADYLAYVFGHRLGEGEFWKTISEPRPIPLNETDINMEAASKDEETSESDQLVEKVTSKSGRLREEDEIVPRVNDKPISDPNIKELKEVLGTSLPHSASRAQSKSLAVRLTLAVLAYLALLLTCVLILALIPLQTDTTRWVIPILCGPPFALIRFWASKRNDKFPHFPVFTFLVNLIGSIMWAITSLLSDSTLLGSALRAAFQTGAAGGLTTISTFMAQLYNLNSRDAIIYFLASALSALLAMALTSIPAFHPPPIWIT